MVVGFKASDNTLILWLDMRSEVRLEVFDSDALEIGRDNVAGKVILKKKYVSSFRLKFAIPFLNPILIEMRSHPSLRIVSIIKPKLCTRLFVKRSRPCCFPYDKRSELLRSVGI